MNRSRPRKYELDIDCNIGKQSKKYYQEHKKERKEYHKNHRQKNKERFEKQRKEDALKLTDKYLINLLKSNIKNAPQELIELKRVQIKLLRATR